MNMLNRRTFVGAAALAGIAIASRPSSAFGVTSAEKKAEAQAAKEKLDSLNSEFEAAVDDYNRAQRTYESATAEVEECQQKIDSTQAKIDGLQGKLSTRATSMYRTGSMSYLDVLLGTASFADFATVWDTLNNLNEDDADLVANNKSARAELEATKQTLDDKQAEAEQALADAKSYKATIEQKKSEYDALYNSLNEEYRQLVAQEEEARRQEEARAAAAYTPAVTSVSSGSSSSGSSGSSGSSQSGGTQSYSGNAAVDRAYSCLGLPYVWGGVGPNGYDCSGLVGYALHGDHKRHYLAQDFASLPTASNPQPGDVVSCSSHHCGLYIGNGQMIEAPHTGAVVKISAVRGRVVRM